MNFGLIHRRSDENNLIWLNSQENFVYSYFNTQVLFCLAKLTNKNNKKHLTAAMDYYYNIFS